MLVFRLTSKNDRLFVLSFLGDLLNQLQVLFASFCFCLIGLVASPLDWYVQLLSNWHRSFKT